MKHVRLFFIFITLLFSFIFLSSCSQNRSHPLANQNRYTNRIYKNLPHYAKLSRQSWQKIDTKTPIKVGMKNSWVPTIRERLVQLKDLNAQEKSDSKLYTKSLANAVRHFQWRHGLKASGVIDRKTLEALNLTPRQRYQKLMLNMKRWAKFPDKEGSHFILVNVPSFDLNIIKDGNKVMNMKVIAGRPDRPTPILYSKMRTVVFNPNWNVPRKLIKEDIIPKIKKDPNYLNENKIAIFSSWKKNAERIDPNTIDWDLAQYERFKYRMTQLPGPKNALGQVKFIFMNEHDVYLHDTPQKGLFKRIQRAYSSGCVRVEKPFKLVEYFLKENPEQQKEKVDEYLSNKQLKYVKMKTPIPIYIDYITAWVDKNGVTHFRDDIYQKDY